MATILDEFVTKFVYKTDKSGLDKAEKGLASFRKSLLKIGATIAATFGGVEFIKSVSETEENLLQLSETLGTTTDELDALEFAAKRSGVSVGDLETSLQNVNRVLGEAARGTGTGAQIFGRFGLEAIDAQGNIKNSVRFLKDLNVEFQSLSTAQRFDLASQVGLSPNLLRLLVKAPKEFDELIKRAKELGVTNSEDAKQAEKYRNSLKDMNQSLQKLGEVLGRTIFPALTFFNGVLISTLKWIRKNSSFVKILIGLLAVLTIRLKGIASAVKLLEIIAAPFTLAAAAVAVLALAIQDLYKWYEGAPSAIGKFLGPMPRLRSFINALIPIIKKLGHFLKIFLIDVFKGSGAVFDMFAKGIKGVISGISTFVSWISKAIDKTKEFFGLKEKASKDNGTGQVNANFAPVNLLSTAPIAGVSGAANIPGGGSVTNQTTVKVGDIKIDAPGADASTIAQQIRGHLAVQLKNAVEDNDSTIAR